jgi:RNA polymerase sigma-B factor
MPRSSEYDDVAGMFRELAALEGGSAAHRRRRDAIVVRTLPLAEHLAARYRNRGEHFDDLVQVARVGLMNAVDRFDVGSGSDFLAFAVPTIRGELRRYFRDHSWGIHVPRRLKDMQPDLRRARDELTQRTGHAPTASQIAHHLGLDRELVVQAIIADSNYKSLSIEAPIGTDGEVRTIADRLGSTDSNLDNVIAAQTVRPLLAALPERQRMILTLRFFDNMTQSQIAEKIGCSQMHVSRLLTQALATLRQQANTPELVAAG